MELGTIVSTAAKVFPKVCSVIYQRLQAPTLTNLAEDGARVAECLWTTPALERLALSTSLSGERGGLENFLASEDFESFMLQLIAARPRLSKDDLEKIVKRLGELLSEHGVIEDEQQRANCASDLADIFYEVTSLMWDSAGGLGFLTQQSTFGAASLSLVADALTSIRNEFKNIVSITPAERRDLERFASSYREQVGSRFKYVNHPSLSNVSPIPFDDLYVAPNLSFLKQHSFVDTEKAIPPQKALAISYRSVILGSPGAGKSTFAGKLCHDLWLYPDTAQFGGRRLIPILVVLRDYAVQRKESQQSILQFIETRAQMDYQVPQPPRAIERLLRTSRAVVIFDGLDELLDTRDRIEITRTVESFATMYPCVPILVTSRERGYEEAPLDPDRFATFKLQSFTEEQVLAYATKWFKFGLEGTQEQRKARTQAFMVESSTVPDLRTNPLLLALLCNLYKQDGYLPRYRPDIYERCAELLFEQWDRYRQIRAPLSAEYHLRPLMYHLANWIYSAEELQSGVTEDRLVEESTQYLQDFFDSRAKAASYAREFIDLFKGRAWVFSDTGSNEDERLYTFTHRTFLEYFTAKYIVGRAQNSDSLGDLLLPKIAKQEWETVTLLAYQMQAKAYKEAADDLINKMRGRAQASEDQTEKASILLFAVGFMGVVRCTPSCRRALLSDSCRLVLRRLSSKRGIGGPKLDEALATLVQRIVTLLNDEGKPYISEINNEIEAFLQKSKSSERPAFRFLSLLSPGGLLFYDYSVPASVANEWDEATKQFRKLHQDSFIASAKADRHIAMESFYNDQLGFKEIIEWHGLTPLFEDTPVLLQQGFRIALLEDITVKLLSGEALRGREELIEVVAERMQNTLPIADLGNYRSVLELQLRRRTLPIWPKTHSERVIVTTVLLANRMLANTATQTPELSLLKEIQKVHDDKRPPIDRDALKILGLPPRFEDLIAHWMARRVELFRSRRKASSGKPDEGRVPTLRLLEP